MPENPISATKSQVEAAPGEFNFGDCAGIKPEIKRRNVKSKASEVKAGGVAKSTDSNPGSNNRPERKPASPAIHPAEPVQSSPSPSVPAKTSVAPKTMAGPATTISQATVENTNPKFKSSAAKPTTAPAIRSTATPSISPHGTRPATLYYSSSTSQEKAAPSTPMKTIPTASPASSPTPAPSMTARSTVATGSRPTTSVDYRANVERQSREQKSVGSILSYIVYALIAFFVLSAALAGYGAHVIFKQLNDQSVTVSDLDRKFSDANKALLTKLTATQDALTAAQAQIARQQEVIVAEQQDINKLISATNDNSSAIKAEKSARAAETANLRSHVRELENRSSSPRN